MLESQYKTLEGLIDALAARIGSLGEKSIGTLRDFSSLARLQVYPGKHPSQNAILKDLFDDHESIIRQLVSDIGDCAGSGADPDTADFLTRMLGVHQAIAGQLRKHHN